MDRRIQVASSSGGWSPSVLSPIAWFYASSDYVSVSAGLVSQWRDRSGNNNHVSQATVAAQPTWEAGSGWGGRSSLACSGAESLITTSGSIISEVSGTDIPFSVFVTFQVITISDNTLCAWDDTGGSAASNCRLDNPALNTVRYIRTNDSGGSDSKSGSVQFGNVHTRAAYIYQGSGSGPQIIAYVNDSAAIGTTSGSGACTFNRFRLFDGPGTTDSFLGRATEFVVLARAASVAEYLAYYNYSLTEWG